MMTVSLEDVMKNTKGQVPYQKSLKVTVVAVDPARSFKTDHGENKQVLNAAVADVSRSCKAVVYDHTKFMRFKEGNTIIIRNFVKKPDCVVINTATKVFPTQKEHVPEEIQQAAIMLLRPPPADVKPLKDALLSPMKTRVSVQGQILQEEAVHQVTVRNDKVNVKAIYLKDHSHPRCKVSLWREAADEEIRAGDYVQITNVITNTFRNETSLSTTSLTTIKKTDAPEEEIVIQIVGCCVEEVSVSFLKSDDDVLEVPIDVVKAALADVAECDMEEHITSKCSPAFPLEMKCLCKGGDVSNITFQ